MQPQGGQQQGDEHCDRGDRHQEFDDREPRAPGRLQSAHDWRPSARKESEIFPAFGAVANGLGDNLVPFRSDASRARSIAMAVTDVRTGDARDADATTPLPLTPPAAVLVTGAGVGAGAVRVTTGGIAVSGGLYVSAAA